ncbi:MAG TPA: NeuD/PglB/VioB family sugar acetyltransferase [Ramlibacter sp.]|nr:NeuD/PglB/VioB family sugar acetyltransferase [Ramlibacter sp.]
MQDASTLVIFGAGGHGRVVADAALAGGRWRRIVATDRDPARCVGELLPGVPLLAVGEAQALSDAVFHIAIGHAESREREAAAFEGRLATVVHPSAAVSPFASIGGGSFVAACAVLAPGAALGSCAILNHGAVVDHDAGVGAFSHVAPNAALGGHSRVGAWVLVGAGAKVLPSVRVCDRVVLGANTVVLRPITEAGVYAGVPAGRVR